MRLTIIFFDQCMGFEPMSPPGKGGVLDPYTNKDFSRYEELNISANDFFYPDSSGVPVGTTTENLLARKQLLTQIFLCSDYEIGIIKSTTDGILRAIRNGHEIISTDSK